jgi:hypothetical protein
MKRRPPAILERKLGRQRAAGQHIFGTQVIEVDPRQTSRERMDTVVHEALHYGRPDLNEAEVERVAHIIAGALWRDRYRRIEE